MSTSTESARGWRRWRADSSQPLEIKWHAGGGIARAASRPGLLQRSAPPDRTPVPLAHEWAATQPIHALTRSAPSSVADRPRLRRPIEAQEVTGSCGGGVAGRGTGRRTAACSPALEGIPALSGSGISVVAETPYRDAWDDLALVLRCPGYDLARVLKRSHATPRTRDKSSRQPCSCSNIDHVRDVELPLEA